MSSRRDFFKKLGMGGLFLGFGGYTLASQAAKNKLTKITLLHTNDMHSHIDPFPESDPKHPGLGGFARINALVKRIRATEEHTLLLDCGDIYQGTPYFNFFKGEAELKLMSKIGYDAGTIGNHEFDNGLVGISSQMKHMNFPFINSNYDFTGTKLEGEIKPYQIFNRGNIKIGVFGLGVELDGLVSSKNCEGVVYNDPISVAENMIKILKEEQNCDLVICLSHIGYSSQTDEMCDLKLAKETSGIDVILGGHSHTLLETATRVRNLDGNEVVINQVGWAGIALGRIDFYIDKEEGTKLASSTLHTIDKRLEA
ncbi:bifunctional UDP-sugar hydrolase/5'-nucleotidase [Ancylomarina sp.]|uniref:bifunctional metallophosphatase/5'-nucleotidase n=1 Tax=Ancylomarina sp. TaxID=1970196 RepID=UPI00356682EB